MKNKSYTKIFAIKFSGYPDPELNSTKIEKAIQLLIDNNRETINHGIKRGSEKWLGCNYNINCIEISSLVKSNRRSDWWEEPYQ